MVAQTPVVTLAAGATGTATLNLGSINGFNSSVGSRVHRAHGIDLQPESHLGHGKWKHHGDAYHRCLHPCQQRDQDCRSFPPAHRLVRRQRRSHPGLCLPIGYSSTAAEMARLAEPGRSGRSHRRHRLRRWRQLVYADPDPDPNSDTHSDVRLHCGRHLHHRGDGHARHDHLTRNTDYGDRDGGFLGLVGLKERSRCKNRKRNSRSLHCAALRSG